MENRDSPVEAMRTMATESLETARRTCVSYVELTDKTLRCLPNVNGDAISAFTANMERQIAANCALADKLLRAKDFQEVVAIQVDYFRSQFTAAADNTGRACAKMTESLMRRAA